MTIFKKGFLLSHILSFLLVVARPLQAQTVLSPISLDYVKFQNASMVAHKFDQIHGAVSFTNYFSHPQYFLDTCPNNNCQGDVRTFAAVALVNAFLFRKTGSAVYLNRAKFLLQQLINKYPLWRTIEGTWILNSIAGYSFGLAGWLISDYLDANLSQSVKSILISEADAYLKIPIKGFTGHGWNTEAEENASPPALLSLAAILNPKHVRSQKWLQKAACYAYHSITIGKDQPFCGVRTRTAFDNGASIGIFRVAQQPSGSLAGGFYLDHDGDFVWVPGIKIPGPNSVATRDLPMTSDRYTLDGDRKYVFGRSDNQPLAGDWDGNGVDEVGTWSKETHQFFLDKNGDGKWLATQDRVAGPFGSDGDKALAGDWDGDGKDNLAVFRPFDSGIGQGAYFLDVNGDGKFSSTDKKIRFGLPGDRPLAGKFTNKVVDQIAVYRPSTGQVYYDRNIDFAWHRTMDGRAKFDPFSHLSSEEQLALRNRVLPIAGDWDDDGFDSLGLYDPKTSEFYLDWNHNMVWDSGDAKFAFGQPTSAPSQVPVVGRFTKRIPFIMANHHIRPHVSYMTAPLLLFMEASLPFIAFQKPVLPQLLHNARPLWDVSKKYVNTTNFVWNRVEDWRSSGLTREVGAVTFACAILKVDCAMEANLLSYKATTDGWFVEMRQIPANQHYAYYGYQFQRFLYPPQVTAKARHTAALTYTLDAYVAKRYIITALTHNPEYLVKSRFYREAQ